MLKHQKISMNTRLVLVNMYNELLCQHHDLKLGTSMKYSQYAVLKNCDKCIMHWKSYILISMKCTIRFTNKSNIY